MTSITAGSRIARFGTLIAAWLALAVGISLVIVLTTSVGYVIGWLLVVLLVTVALVGVRRAAGDRGPDASRSSDASVPHHGFDDATPLGDTDQHASERSARR